MDVSRLWDLLLYYLYSLPQQGSSENYKTKFKDFLSTFHGTINDF